MNYVIVRNKSSFAPSKTVPVLAFECSYGLEIDNGSNEFSCKVAKSEGLLELGSFVQFQANNGGKIPDGGYINSKTDWCGKILRRDIDNVSGIVTYAGVSLLGAINNFVPVRTTEEIPTLQMMFLSNPSVSEDILSTGLAKISLRLRNSVTLAPVISRVNQLCDYAYYPIKFRQGENTYFGNGYPPSDFDYSRDSWYDLLDRYRDYRYAGHSGESGDETVYANYCSDGNVYIDPEPIPSGVTLYFYVMFSKTYVTLDHSKGVMDSIQDGLPLDTEIQVSIHGNLPLIHLFPKYPRKSDYIYIHNGLGLKLFDAMPYTAGATGSESYTPDYNTAVFRLKNKTDTLRDVGYYDLQFGTREGFGNDEQWETSGGLLYSSGGNLHMLKISGVDYNQLWNSGQEEIEKLSYELTIDGSDDTDYVLQRNYIFIRPQETPELLFSDISSGGGENKMKVLLKNKKIVADAYSCKKIYSFYPNLSHAD